VTLRLRPPGPGDEAAARALHEELLADGFSFLLSDGTWEEVLASCERDAAGTDLPPDRVRADFLLAEVDGEVVGRVSVRHELTPSLLEVGGHVGYAVGPRFRRRGHATEILRQSLARLRDLGVELVLVTCDDDNTGSARVIEACGGVLEDVRTVEGHLPKRRYWITP
jgi:predicted acetyltransferase